MMKYARRRRTTGAAYHQPAQKENSRPASPASPAPGAIKGPVGDGRRGLPQNPEG